MTRLYYILIGLLIGISLSTFPTEVIIMDYSSLEYGIDVYDYSGHTEDNPCEDQDQRWWE